MRMLLDSVILFTRSIWRVNMYCGARQKLQLVQKCMTRAVGNIMSLFHGKPFGHGQVYLGMHPVS